MTDDFDYHRVLTDAVADAPSSDPDRLVWIMTPEFRLGLMQFNQGMGVEVDASEYFGIPIMVGEPSGDEPFELKLRGPH